MQLSYIIVGPNTIDNIFLKQIAKNFPSLILKGEFLKLEDGIELINSQKIDFLLLDSNLSHPFEFTNEIFNNTEVVLTTNKSFDAISSYTYGFIDCLLKPISLDRFKTTLLRIKKKLKHSRVIEKKKDLKIEIKSNYKNQKIKVNEIKWIEAMGDYIKIVTKRKNYIVLSTMKSFIKKLPRKNFFRIHKSFIINLMSVTNYTSNYVNLKGKSIPISRNKKKEFKKIFLDYQ
ncbi:MAG: LytTR family DNA-binding domain-containing protein [Bacteroidota bacterium]|nr:LytTR family DNA-binding domain-containing protein [Bacteroidota bacterium]